MIHNIHYVLYCPLKMYCRYMFYKTLKFIIKKREENKKMNKKDLNALLKKIESYSLKELDRLLFSVSISFLHHEKKKVLVDKITKVKKEKTLALQTAIIQNNEKLEID